MPGNKEDPKVKAFAWVEAENICKAWCVVDKWFQLMQTGEADNHLPDPLWHRRDHGKKAPLTQELADKFIEELDEDFLIEKGRFGGRLPPDFSRLSPSGRIAFVQEMYEVLLTEEELEEEADRRLKAKDIPVLAA
ncbi:MAG TPA: hypothetical protein VFE94_04130 [Candidatus Paceibacterota bacterium]|nr:hypothetical protein [Candidatus Paceibacterota bacterium]